MFRKNDHQVYVCVALEQFGWLRHGFATRHSSGWPPYTSVASVRQVHSNRVITAGAFAECLGEADALVTDQAGVFLGIRTADCLPVLLVAPELRVVAAIHAGWRGTAGEIAAKTVERICTGFSGSPAALHAAIGPGIGPCCYEVGPEVAARFTASSAPGANGRSVMLDLVDANRRQFLAAGLPSSQIHTGAPCTCCAPDEFHSYRREGERAGRMLSLIGIAEG